MRLISKFIITTFQWIIFFVYTLKYSTTCQWNIIPWKCTKHNKMHFETVLSIPRMFWFYKESLRIQINRYLSKGHTLKSWQRYNPSSIWSVSLNLHKSFVRVIRDGKRLETSLSCLEWSELNILYEYTFRAFLQNSRIKFSGNQSRTKTWASHGLPTLKFK